MAAWDFDVRDWLAARLRCQPDQLDLLGEAQATARDQEARYDLDGGSEAVVLITWAVPAFRGRTSRTVVATLPAGDALHVLDGSEHISW